MAQMRCNYLQVSRDASDKLSSATRSQRQTGGRLKSEISEFLVQAEVKAESTVLIAHAAEGPARRKMIFHLDNLILG